jgi:hypothetical protein
MKTVILLCSLASAALAGSPVLVKITPEAILKLQQSSPMTRLEQVAQGTATPPRPAEQSIIKQSAILHDGKHWTLVPKGSVVFIPTALKNRVNVKPVGTLLAWADFLVKNRSWITTTDISFDQAAGSEPLPAERAAFWAKQDKVVVAVHQNGPISVRVNPESQTLTQR